MAREVTMEDIEHIEEMIARAQKAAEIIATYDQARVDHLCQAVAASLYDLKVWAPCATKPWMRPTLATR